jgi:hypothetical protein
MKRSIKKIAVFVVLSVFLASCSEDLGDTSPEIPNAPSNSFTFLQGDWELVDKDNINDGSTLHFENDMAVQKLPSGTLVRAAQFQIIKLDDGNNIVYGNNIINNVEKGSTPNFFKNPRIVSADANKLVLEGKEVFTFKKLDPVN